MPKSLAKVQKKISKKGANISSLHENSRNSQLLRRASARDDKLARLSSARAKVNQPHIHRIAYFQEAASSATESFSLGQLLQLIERYINRDDEEVSKLENERRPGRPRSTREDMLKQRITMEKREYEAGFWMPHMTDLPNLEILRRWNGEWTSLNTMKYVRTAKSGVIHDSAFPPKSQS
ncbi:hypothetical protein MMC13_000302 [Lambiella insularis]|nr:hypothetical protein [Lambiella insularis]